MVVALTTTGLVAVAPPTSTQEPATKFVPVMVTTVPPAVGPLAGDTDVMVGLPGFAVNVAVTFRAWVIVTVQTLVPVQASDQPLNDDPVAAVAVSVTVAL